MDTKINAKDILEHQVWYSAYKTVNYISGISNKPKTIPFGVSDDTNNDDDNNRLIGYDNDNDNETGFVDTITTGLGILHERIVGTAKSSNVLDWNGFDDHKHRYLGNNNIINPATSSTLNPHDCLQFAPKDNWIELHLSHRIRPTNFIYIHIDKTKIDKNDKNKSPKRFRLFGKLISSDDWKEIKILENNQKQIMDIDDNVIELELIPESEVEFVKIEYETNDNAETTRLYRFRIECDQKKVDKYVKENEN